MAWRAYIAVRTQGWRTGPRDVLRRLLDPALADCVARVQLPPVRVHGDGRRTVQSHQHEDVGREWRADGRRWSTMRI